METLLRAQLHFIKPLKIHNHYFKISHLNRYFTKRPQSNTPTHRITFRATKQLTTTHFQPISNHGTCRRLHKSRINFRPPSQCAHGACSVHADLHRLLHPPHGERNASQRAARYDAQGEACFPHTSPRGTSMG